MCLAINFNLRLVVNFNLRAGPFLVAYLTDTKQVNEQMRCAALCLCDDLIEHASPESHTLLGAFLPALLEAVKFTNEPVVRQPALYGVGECATREYKRADSTWAGSECSCRLVTGDCLLSMHLSLSISPQACARSPRAPSSTRTRAKPPSASLRACKRQAPATRITSAARITRSAR